MRRPFLLLFAGVLLVALDVLARGTGLTTAWLGCVLAAVAAHRLVAVEPVYVMARAAFAVGALLGVVQLLVPTQLSGAGARPVGELVLLWSLVTAGLLTEAVGIVVALTAIMWASKAASATGLAAQVRNRRVYVLVATVGVVGSLLVTAFTDRAAHWVVFFTLALLLAQALVLAALVRADRQLPDHGLSAVTR